MSRRHPVVIVMLLGVVLCGAGPPFLSTETDQAQSRPLAASTRCSPDPDGSWLPMSGVGAPPILPGQAAWTGQEMLVLVGNPRSGSRGFSTGGRYDPVQDVWHSMSMVGAPRQGHLIWTGHELLVWGGQAEGESGGRYDPATDTWRPMATAGAPAGLGERGGGQENVSRFIPELLVWEPFTRFVTVWTGEELLVWGTITPLEAREPTTMGARYDPESDTWRALPPLPLPMASLGASLSLVGVWTGEELIVWGGRTPGGAIPGAGARFNPQTGEWMPMSVVGAPAGRDQYGVWTGTRFLLWGGRADSFSFSFRAGGLYDPASDTWEPMSVEGAPLWRDYMSSIWTGHEFVLWGGQRERGPGALTVQTYDDGAAYDPATDTWRTLAATELTARTKHAAVWTGLEMVIFGGEWIERPSQPRVPRGSGGKYFPPC